MEVTHYDNQNSHAVVGGSDVRSFGISNNAEFITMLSEGMYSHKNMAFIREVMCNSQDAHIISGQPDRPIEITITDKEISFRDYGPGIADDLIGPIYCIYGNSTKKSSKEETGGFGLGSKAPFAYTEHFSVTSFFDGTKTIYAVSRGTEETDNKPDMRTMVSVPTKESGLLVSVPLKNINDKITLSKIIKEIAYLGQIKVLLNGESLECLDFKNKPFTIFNRSNNPNIFDFPFSSDIYVQYGSVIYPVLEQKEYEEQRAKIRRVIFGRTQSTSNQEILLIKAPADSIAVHPSREMLSMNTKTIDTLTNLFEDILTSIEKNIPKALELAINTALDYYVSKKDTLALNELIASHQFATAHYSSSKSSLIIKDLPKNKHTELASACIKFNCFREFPPVAKTFNDFMKAKLVLLFPKMKELFENYYSQSVETKTSDLWFNYNYFNKLKKLMPDVFDKMYIVKRNYGRKDTFIKVSELTDYSTFELAVDAFNSHKLNHFNNGLFLSPLIHFSYNQKDSLDHINESEKYGFACIVPRKKGVDEALMEEAKKQGFTIEEHLLASTYIPPDRTVTKKKPGYVKLSSCISAGNSYLKGKLGCDTVDRIKEPTHIIEEVSEYRRRHPKGIRRLNLTDVVNVFPDTAIVSNTSTKERVIKKFSSLDVRDALVDEIVKESKKSTTFFEALLIKSFDHKATGITLIRIAEKVPSIAKMVNFTPPTDKRINSLACICDNLESCHHYGYDTFTSYDYKKKHREVIAEFEKFKESHPYVKFLKTRKMLKYFSIDNIAKDILASKKPNPDHIALLEIALEG